MSHQILLRLKLAPFIFCCIYIAHLTQANTDFLYMTHYCSKSVLVDTSLLLSLTVPGNLPDDRERDRDFVHCDLELLAPKGMKLFAHFIQLGISPVADHSDRLHLYDLATNQTRLTPNKGLYGRLDRALSIFDSSGTQVNDYRTISNKMKVDYLGKPTKKSPGFRLLVTPFQDPSYSEHCPARYYLCSRAYICIGRQLTCDGNPNCGKDDSGDEKGCDRYDTITNLLVEYSLTKDIIIVIILPLFVFIVCVVIVFAVAKAYIRKKINAPELPTVHFSPKKDGQVRIAEDAGILAPPPYEYILDPPTSYDPPPAYSRLTGCGRNSEKFWDPGDEAIESSESHGREQGHKQISEMKQASHPICGKDGSCTDRIPDTDDEDYRLHHVWPSDTDEDEEIKAKRRRKGGKVKGKKKRSNMDGADNSECSSPPSSTSRESTPGKSSESSVPCSESLTESVIADSARTHVSPLTLRPYSESAPPPCHDTLTRLNNSQEQSENFISLHDKLTNVSHASPANIQITADCPKSGNTSGTVTF